MLTVAIDLGGTAIKGAIIDTSDYSVARFTTIKTEAELGKDRILANLFKTIDTLLPYSDGRTIAISSAGTINWNDGSVNYTTDSLPDFTGLRLRDVIENKYNIRTVVINDATAALIGEAFTKEDSNAVCTLMLTLGTGLGSSIVCYDYPLDANAVENLKLGHYALHENGRLCKCGKCGCAEQYVSATGLKSDNEGREIDFGGTMSVNDRCALDEFVEDFINLLLVAEKEYKPSSILIGGGIIEKENG